MDALADPRLVEAVSAYFAAISARALDGWLELFTDDAVSHDPVGTVPAEGREALKEEWRMLTAPFERLSMVEEQAFYCGTGAAVKWKAEGLGVNGGSVVFHGITVFEMTADGKIQTVMAYWDPAAMMIEMAGETPDHAKH
jgi:ketosteroid isomerase-like protein